MKLGNLIYNKYGSSDSTDTDVVVYLKDLPDHVEDRKNLTNEIKKKYNVNWNIIIAKVEDGIIVDCTYPKSFPSGLNNSIYLTYNNHEQEYPCQVTRLVNRNIATSVYRTIHKLQTLITRTQYRKNIRPYMHYSVDFKMKLENLLAVDFTEITTFNQQNMNDVDIWKVIAFELVQNYALLKDNISIHEKSAAVNYDKNTFNLIYRQHISTKEKLYINNLIQRYISLIKEHKISQDNTIFYFDSNYCDMVKMI